MSKQPLIKHVDELYDYDELYRLTDYDRGHAAWPTPAHDDNGNMTSVPTVVANGDGTLTTTIEVTVNFSPDDPLDTHVLFGVINMDTAEVLVEIWIEIGSTGTVTWTNPPGAALGFEIEGFYITPID